MNEQNSKLAHMAIFQVPLWGGNELFVHCCCQVGFLYYQKGSISSWYRTCRTDKNTDRLGLKGWAHSSCPPCARPFLIARFRNIWSYGRRPRNMVQLTEFNPPKNIWRIGLSSTPAFSSAGSVGSRIGSTILGPDKQPWQHSPSLAYNLLSTGKTVVKI
jgi:hypothetical protein